ncbi:MAG: restriction endonuclease subunit S [Methanoregula sp.]
MGSKISSKEVQDDLPVLPQDWIRTKIIDVCYVNSGRTPQNIDLFSSEGDINFFKISDMNTPDNEQFMSHSKIKISFSKITELKLKPQPEGTVIFPKRGGAIATNKKRILLKPSLYDLNLMGVTPLQIPSKFMYYWFLKQDLAQLSDGSNIPQINHQDIEPDIRH